MEITYADFIRARSSPASTEAAYQMSRTAAMEDIWLDLRPFVNSSAMSVHTRFSLHRTYNIFRSLGLRHLVVVDDDYKVAGIITRKDLMGFAIEEKL